MELSPELITWIEELTGGTVDRVEHQSRWRPHFFVDVTEADGATLELLVRLARDPELVPLSDFLSRFDLAHEARVLEALQATEVKVPRYLGFHDGAPAILMERVAGTNDLADVAEVDRAPLLLGYIDNLHRLHTTPIDDTTAAMLSSDDLSTPEGLAFAMFGHLEADSRKAQPFLRPEPLLELALWWLHENVPRHRNEPRWVQGDTGPGQFMADGTTLTALIDWELSHLGDPLLDLGVMRMRNMLYPVGDLRALFERYEQLTDEPIDRETLVFYTVLSTLLTPLGLAMSIQNPEAASASMLPRFGWDVTLRRGLCEALCEAYGVEVEPLSIVDHAPTTPPRSDLDQFLVEYLEAQCVPIASTDHEDFVLSGAVAVARATLLARTDGPRLDADDLDDMARVLGQCPEDREAGLELLSRLVASDPEDAAPDLLWLFTRMEQRREHLWRPLLVAQESEPLERLYPAERTLEGPRR